MRKTCLRTEWSSRRPGAVFKIKIVYIPKEILAPFFGLADDENKIVYIRADLLPKVRDFVKLHELYHLNDQAGWWVWREIKASAAAALKNPLGFILCLLMSCTGERFGLYWRRIKKGG